MAESGEEVVPVRAHVTFEHDEAPPPPDDHQAESDAPPAKENDDAIKEDDDDAEGGLSLLLRAFKGVMRGAGLGLSLPLRPIVTALPGPVLLVLLVLATTVAADRSTATQSDWAFMGVYVGLTLSIVQLAAVVIWVLGNGFASVLAPKTLGVLLGLVLSSIGVGISVLVNRGLQTADTSSFHDGDGARTRRTYLHGMMGAMLALMILYVLSLTSACTA